MTKETHRNYGWIVIVAVTVVAVVALATLFGDFMPKSMNEFGFYYDTEYTWTYDEDGFTEFEGVSFIFREDGSVQINVENGSLNDILPEDLEYSHRKIVGKNLLRGVEFHFSKDGKTLTYKYPKISDAVFGMVE